MKAIKYLLILTMVLIAVSPGQGASDKSFNKKRMKDLLASTTRFMESLSGQWEMTTDESGPDFVELPMSYPGQERIELTRTIRLDKTLLRRYAWHLYFLGIDDETEVYVNNQFVGRYFSGNTPFFIRIPDKMLKGQTNTIKLVVSPAKAGARQVKEQHLFSKKVYTGVVRDLFLMGSPVIWVSDVKYNTKVNSTHSFATLNSTVNISSADLARLKHSFSDSLPVEVNLNKSKITLKQQLKHKITGELIAESHPQILEISSNRTITAECKLSVNNPKMWSPENPHLYNLITILSKSEQTIDAVANPAGFVSAHVVKGDKPALAVNGRRFEFSGVDYIEAQYGSGQTVSPYRMEQDVKLMKTLGVNVVKYKYTTPHPYFVSLCNRYGIFLMSELPIYDIPSSLINSDEIRVRMRNIAQRMALAYDSAPALLAWGISDGLMPGSKQSQEFTKGVIKLLRSKSDKLIYKTVQLDFGNIDTEGFDFIGLRDIGRLTHYDKTVDLLAKRAGEGFDLPVFINYGIAIEPDNHNGYKDILSLESQANYIFNIYHTVKSMGFAGSVVWSFNDYYSNYPLLITNTEDQYLCNSGMVDQKRQPRLSFKTLQSLFNSEKEPLLHAGSYSEDAPISFIIFGIVLCVVILFMVNRFKRFREYLFRSVMKPYNFYADIRDQRIMSSIQTFLLGLVISFTIGGYVASLIYFYKTNVMTQYIFMLALPWKGAQEALFNFVWMPEVLTLIFSALFFALIFILSGILKIASSFVRGKIFFSDTYTIVIWSASPALALLPFSIVLSRLLLLSPITVTIVIVAMVLMFIWIFFRILRSTSVVFDVRSFFVYLSGLMLLLIAIAAIIGIYQYQFSIVSYVEHLFAVLTNF